MEAKLWMLVPAKTDARPMALRYLPAVIGRAPDCDFFVDDSTISKRHLEVRTEGSTLTFQDLGSSNGTKLNGLDITNQEASLEPAENPGPVEITKGIRLDLGSTVYYLHYLTEAQASEVMNHYLPKDEQWFYLREGQRIGPVTEEELLVAANRGLITPTANLWRADRPEPLQARNVEGLFPG